MRCFKLHHQPLPEDFDLTVGEVEHARQLQALLFVDVHAEEELPLQLADLVLGVGAALFSGGLTAELSPPSSGKDPTRG